MDPSKEAAEPRFEPPGPGSWELDPVHFPRPATRYMAETHPEPFRRGVQDFARFYGMLIDGLEYRYVNGFPYKTMHPVAPEEIPQRFRRAEEVFAKTLWAKLELRDRLLQRNRYAEDTAREDDPVSRCRVHNVRCSGAVRCDFSAEAIARKLPARIFFM